MNHSIERHLPLTGIAFVVLLVTGVGILGDSPAMDAPSDEVITYLIDNETTVRISTLILALAVFVLVAFVGRVTADAREQTDRPALATAAAASGAIAATTVAIDATLRFVLVEAAGDIAPEAIQGIYVLSYGFFLAAHIGVGAFVLTASLAKPGPIWMVGLGVVAATLLIVPVVAVTFIGIILAGIWFIATSILLNRQ